VVRYDFFGSFFFWEESNIAILGEYILEPVGDALRLCLQRLFCLITYFKTFFILHGPLKTT
jgi:hypothetical protein